VKEASLSRRGLQKREGIGERIGAFLQISTKEGGRVVSPGDSQARSLEKSWLKYSPRLTKHIPREGNDLDKAQASGQEAETCRRGSKPSSIIQN